MSSVVVEVLTDDPVVVDPSLDQGIDVEILLDDQPVVEVPAGTTDVVDVFAGIKGDAGPQGIQGIQGPKGDTGAQGPAGNTQALNTNISVATALSGSRTFSHNLGWVPSGVLFFDSGGKPVNVQVTAVTSTSITIYSDLPFSGTIMLS